MLYKPMVKLNNGRQQEIELKLKDKYYFDGTSIKDAQGNSIAIADLAPIRLNVRGGQTFSDETSVTGSDDKKYGDKIISASELAANYFKSSNISNASNNPTIKISNDAILEALPGVK